MKQLTLIITLLMFHQTSFSQTEMKLDWDLQYSNTKIHLNHSDIGIWIKQLDTIMDRVPKIKIVADKNSEFIKVSFISFERNKGALIKIDLLSNQNMVGYTNKLLIIDENQNSLIGHLIIPIGTDQPIIDAYNSKGQLLVGGDFQKINLLGTNLDGVSEVISDGKIIIKSMDSKNRNDQIISIQMKANYNDYLNNTSFQCKYLEFDPFSKSLIEKVTPFFNTNIGIYKSSVIELEPLQTDFYVTDIIRKGGNLKTKILNKPNTIETVDYQNLRIIPQKFLGQGSWIRLSNTNEGELSLDFKDVQSMLGENVFIEFDLVGSNQKYRVGFNLLPEPNITTIENNQGDQKYIINKDIEQLIMRIKG